MTNEGEAKEGEAKAESDMKVEEEKLLKDAAAKYSYFEQNCPSARGYPGNCKVARHYLYDIYDRTTAFIMETGKKEETITDVEIVANYAEELLRSCGNRVCGDCLIKYVEYKSFFSKQGKDTK